MNAFDSRNQRTESVGQTVTLFCPAVISVGNPDVKVKVKQSHYRPGQAQRVLRKLRFPDFVTTAQDGGRL